MSAGDVRAVDGAPPDEVARGLESWAAIVTDETSRLLLSRAAKGIRRLAAVAELIEAVNFARETAGAGLGYTPGVDRRLAAALARVQGGQP